MGNGIFKISSDQVGRIVINIFVMHMIIFTCDFSKHWFLGHFTAEKHIQQTILNLNRKYLLHIIDQIKIGYRCVSGITHLCIKVFGH